MRHRLLSALAPVLAGLAFGQTGRADTVTIYAHDSQFGSFDANGVPTGYYAAPYENPAVLEVRALAEFSLASLPSVPSGFKLQIDSATFGLFGSAMNPYDAPLNIYGYAGDGTASASDYGSGDYVGTRNSFSLGTYNDLDATSFIQSLVDDNAEWAGFNVRKESGTSYYNFGTAYFPPYYYSVPKLSITYSLAAVASVPLPGAAGAGLTLMGLLAASTRISRKQI
jgi:hypothetical protein